MSTRLGSTSPGTGTYEYTDSPNANVIGGALTLPAGGPWLISRLGAFFGGKASAATSKLALYSTGGTLLAKAASTFEATGRVWMDDGDSYEQDLSAVYQVAGGTTIVVAFVCDLADARLWRDKTTGTQYYGVAGSAATPANVGWTTQTPGPPAVWLYYDAALPEVYVRRSGVWVKSTALQVRRSGAWANVTELDVRRSGAWTKL